VTRPIPPRWSTVAPAASPTRKIMNYGWSISTLTWGQKTSSNRGSVAAEGSARGRTPSRGGQRGAGLVGADARPSADRANACSGGGPPRSALAESIGVSGPVVDGVQTSVTWGDAMSEAEDGSRPHADGTASRTSAGPRGPAAAQGTGQGPGRRPGVR
jgi:hypothetical protein